MFWMKKKQVAPSLTVAEFISLDDRLRDIIMKWVMKEIGAGMKPNTKLAEVGIFNFKILFSDNDHSSEMRNFIQNSKNLQGDTEYIFSRIQDLYIEISMSFPKLFIDGIRNRHIAVLKSLGYEVADFIVESFEFGWLMARIQSALRYSSDIKFPVRIK